MELWFGMLLTAFTLDRVINAVFSSPQTESTSSQTISIQNKTGSKIFLPSTPASCACLIAIFKRSTASDTLLDIDITNIGSDGITTNANLPDM
jgi:hypothetical protein